MNERVVNAITEYQPIAAALAGIEKYRGVVFDVATQKGLIEAKAAQREVAAPRIALEKARKKLKEEVLERGRLIDGEAKRIADKIAEIEEPLKAQIEAEERREQEAREAAVRAEQERLAAEERARREAEERRLAEERARLAAEQQRLADERRRLEAEERERRAKLQAEEDARRKAMQEEEDRIRAARRAEEERLAAERAVLEKARREQEEVERKARAEAERVEREAREKKEAAEREARRKEQERMDARQMLATFVSRYGALPEFEKIAAAIKAFLSK